MLIKILVMRWLSSLSIPVVWDRIPRSVRRQLVKHGRDVPPHLWNGVELDMFSQGNIPVLVPIQHLILIIIFGSDIYPEGTVDKIQLWLAQWEPKPLLWNEISEQGQQAMI